MKVKLTDGGDKGCIEGIITESVQNAGFSNAAVADEKEFEEKIVLFLGHD